MTQSDCPVSLPDFSTRLTLTSENIPTACSKMSPAELSAAKDKALRAQREDNELQMAQALSLGLTSADGLRGNLPLMTKMGGYRGAHPTLTNACSAHQCN